MGVLDTVSGAASSAKNSVSSAASSAKNSVSSAYNSASDSAKAAAAAADLYARKKAQTTMLEGTFGEWFANWFMDTQTSLGFQPPSLSQITLIGTFLPYILIFIVVSIIPFILTGIFQSLLLFKRGVFGELSGSSTSVIRKFYIVATVLFLITLFVFFYFYSPTRTAYYDIVSTQKSIGNTQGFQNRDTIKPLDDSLFKLVNIQFLSVKQTGFVGPSENDGVFDPAVGIRTAVRSGVSFFTLQIDYLEREKDLTKFDPVKVPTLLYRDSTGKIISNNGASINEVAKQLETYLFSPDLGASNIPVVLYLHFLKTPDQVKNPKEYLEFFKKVSNDLEPLHQYILKENNSENFRRQKSENSLLHTPLTNMNNKIILMSNADTSIFRNPNATGGSVEPASDLDSFINMQVYLENNSYSFGVTQVASGMKEKAIIVPYEMIFNMSDSERSAFALKNKKRFVIAMPSPLETPTFDEINILINNTGVNTIPINLIGEPEKINKIIKLWKPSRPYYLLKPMMLQSYKEDVMPNGG
jgi:hypothetical protein